MIISWLNMGVHVGAYARENLLSRWAAYDEPEGESKNLRIRLNVYTDHADAWWFPDGRNFIDVDHNEFIKLTISGGDPEEAKRYAIVWIRREFGVDIVQRKEPEIRPIRVHPKTREVMQEIGMLEYPDLVWAEELDPMSTTDAVYWAETFTKRFGGKYITAYTADPEEGEVDFGTMVAWFANAIETGRKAGQDIKVVEDPNVPEGGGIVVPAGAFDAMPTKEHLGRALVEIGDLFANGIAQIFAYTMGGTSDVTWQVKAMYDKLTAKPNVQIDPEEKLVELLQRKVAGLEEMLDQERKNNKQLQLYLVTKSEAAPEEDALPRVPLVPADDVEASFIADLDRLVDGMRERIRVLQEWRTNLLKGDDEYEIRRNEIQRRERALEQTKDVAFQMGKESAVTEIREGLHQVWFGLIPREEQDHEQHR